MIKEGIPFVSGVNRHEYSRSFDESKKLLFFKLTAGVVSAIMFAKNLSAINAIAAFSLSETLSRSERKTAETILGFSLNRERKNNFTDIEVKKADKSFTLVPLNQHS